VPSKHSQKITLDFKDHESNLESDISYLHPDLGAISQTFVRNDEYGELLGGVHLYESIFRIYPKNSKEPTNFSYLHPDIKARLWDEVFFLKNIFLEKRCPDVVMHKVKHPFSCDLRHQRYLASIKAQGYIVLRDNTTIWVERK
jgi:hypothetical protein